MSVGRLQHRFSARGAKAATLEARPHRAGSAARFGLVTQACNPTGLLVTDSRNGRFHRDALMGRVTYRCRAPLELLLLTGADGATL